MSSLAQKRLVSCPSLRAPAEALSSVEGGRHEDDIAGQTARPKRLEVTVLVHFSHTHAGHRRCLHYDHVTSITSLRSASYVR